MALERIRVVSPQLEERARVLETGAAVEIGSGAGCALRLKAPAPEKAAETILQNGTWMLCAAPGVEIGYGGRALRSCRVRAGMSVTLGLSGQEAFARLAFETYAPPTRSYNLRVYLPVEDGARVRIGAQEGCEIRIAKLDHGARAEIVHHGHAWTLRPLSEDGVTVDGRALRREAVLRDRTFFRVGAYSFYVKQGCLYTSADDGAVISGLTSHREEEQSSQLIYPVFKRSSRVRPQILSGEIEVLPPRKKDEQRQQSAVLQIVPPLISLALVVVLRGLMGSGGTFVLYSAATMLLGIVVSVFTRRDQKKQRLLREADRREKYQAYIDDKVGEIVRARQDELVTLHRLYRPYEDNLTILRNFDRGLFDRSAEDEDFMVVRLGVGRVLSREVVRISKQEYKDTDDELMDIAEQVEKKYRYLENAPIVVDMRSVGALGIIGGDDPCYDVIKGITMDLAIRQYFKEIRFFYIFAEEELPRYAWTRWLRNCFEDADHPRNLIYDDESAKVHLEAIYKILAAREEELGQSNAEQGAAFPVYYVIFVMDLERIRNHPLSQFFGKSAQLGCTFVFFSRHEELIPRGCSRIIRLEDRDQQGNLILCANDAENARFRYPVIPDSIMAEAIHKLCPVRVVEANLESSMTRNITLFELLGIKSAGQIDLAKGWKDSDIEHSMAAPLGVRTKNDVIYLDLHERFHGPHGLVAGTTGSGKSEMLQSYILSMAVRFPPEEVAFLIIDFKGGGMADQFASLPHLVGKITNIDGREAQRSLKSIQAESVRRQTLFSQASTPENPINSIGRYIHLRRTAPERAPVALPHLIIIVDEFAELKTTYPDFMQELVSAARIGRSLGIHLILATQKPSGVVDDQIWSNSNFRLCLRVQTREDSKEVLKTPLAAEIREPGRAYLQVGNNEIFELFQSAYSGAKLQTDGGHGNCFRLYEVNPWGKQQVVFDNRPKVREDSQRTELTALVEHISRYCLKNDVPTPAQVCLPPLPESLRLCDVLGERPAGGVAATLGLLDDPERHEQPPLHLDLTESNTFLLGASQTGKSMLLMTAITSIAMHYTPREVNIYLLDGGNSMPRALESSRIVGGVCYREEEERIGNLINMLKREIGRRRRRFVECSVGGFKAYQEAGHDDLPAIVIMLDNAVSFREYCEPLFDQLMFLSREGNGAGIYFMISSTQYAVVPSKVMIGFGTKLALNCNDPGEYSNLFDRCRIQPLDRPGRGLVMINKRILEFQTAWFADGVNEQERNEAMRARFMERNEEYGGCCARPIPMVPEIIPAPELFALAKAAPKYHLPIGMNYEGVEPVYLDLTEQWVLPLVGRQQSGRTNFIRTVMDMIQATTLKNRTDCYIADSPNRPLDYCRRDYGFVREYTVDSGEALGYIAQIAAELERRQQAMVEAGGAVAEAEFLDRLPLLLLAIDNADFVAMASADKETMAQIATIKKLSRYRALLLLNVENLSPISMHTPELAKRVAADKNGLIFDDLGSSVLFSVPPKTVNQYSKPMRVGDCYIYKNGGVVEKVHTALSTAS